LADAAGEVAFSADKAEAKSTETTTVEWLSYIGGPSLEIIGKYLDQAKAESYIPYANVLADYITADEAVARYDNAKAFFGTYGHYNIGTGPYILSEVFLTEKVATLITNPDHPDLSDKWAMFGNPKVAEATVEGEGSITVGSEFTFDVFVTFEGEPYASNEIKEVKGLLYDSTEQIRQRVGWRDGRRRSTMSTPSRRISPLRWVAGPAKSRPLWFRTLRYSDLCCIRIRDHSVTVERFESHSLS